MNTDTVSIKGFFIKYKYLVIAAFIVAILSGVVVSYSFNVFFILFFIGMVLVALPYSLYFRPYFKGKKNPINGEWCLVMIVLILMLGCFVACALIPLFL